MLHREIAKRDLKKPPHQFLMRRPEIFTYPTSHLSRGKSVTSLFFFLFGFVSLQQFLLNLTRHLRIGIELHAVHGPATGQ